MALLSWLTGGVIESAGKVATDVGKTFWGDKTARDAQVSQQTRDVIAEFAAEFVAHQQRTKWDSFIDGVNRLPRPMMALGALASILWAPIDPVGFAQCMQALTLVPDPLWQIWGVIFAFFFGGRILADGLKKWKVDPKALEVAKEIAAERTARRQAEVAEKTGVAADKQANAAEKQAEAAERTAVAAGQSPEILPPVPASKPTLPANDLVPVLKPDARVVAATIWGEARNESREGKIGVAWCIRNRVKNPGWWGSGWVGVCTSKAQFSCWFDQQGERVRALGHPDGASTDPTFVECLDVAEKVMAGELPDPTNGADHYYADYISAPKWARDHEPTVVIGRHRFFKLGLAGRG